METSFDLDSTLVASSNLGSPTSIIINSRILDSSDSDSPIAISSDSDSAIIISDSDSPITISDAAIAIPSDSAIAISDDDSSGYSSVANIGPEQVLAAYLRLVSPHRTSQHRR